MKSFINQKWVLSAFLIAALGSQYYFSISSNNMSVSELASTAADIPTQNIEDAAEILARASGAPSAATPESVPSTDTPVPAANPLPDIAVPASPVRSATEGVATDADCSDCVKLSRTDAEKIRQILAEVVAARQANAPATAATPQALCADEPSQAERLRCERQEREIARREAADLKREQELDARLTRNEEFLDKMSEAADRCRGEISCITSRYTSLLGRYTGSRKVDTAVAQSAYRQHIEPALKSRLASMDDDSESANEIIGELAAGIPMDYRQVKEQMVLAIKQSSEARVASVNETYREATQQLNNKNTMEAQRLFEQANLEHRELSTDLFGNPTQGRVGYFDVLSTELKETDSSTWAYVQSTLISPVRNLFSSINSTTSSNASSNPQDEQNSIHQQNQNAGNRGVVRGGGSQLNTTMNNGKMTTLPSTNSGVVFQQPTTVQRGNRGPR